MSIGLLIAALGAAALAGVFAWRALGYRRSERRRIAELPERPIHAEAEQRFRETLDLER